jgi:hypothetical protein
MKSRIARAAAAICTLVMPGALSAQTWSAGSGGAIYYSSGSVGIGTSSPSFQLQTNGIIAADQGNNVMVLLGQTAGASGAGTSYGGIWYDTSSNSLRIDALSGDVAWRNIVLNGNGSANVGIGTTSPQHLLHVAGTIGAEQVIVSSTGADYVFDPKYKLTPLSEVASYVEENHHLPGIPSAEDMTKQGASLGEMQTKLLAKIEKLTLHMIAAEKRSDDLARQNRELEQKVDQLQEQISEEHKP